LILSVFSGCVSTVPTNQNLSIPSELEPEGIIPTNLGGTDYSETIFSRSSDEWLSLCYEAFGVDDREDVCRGFVRGYLRVYSSYTLEDGTNLTDCHSNMRNGTLVHVIEYETPRDAKYACSFLTIDANYPKISIDDIDFIGMEWDNTAHYALSDRFLISVQGSSRAIRDLVNGVIELFRKRTAPSSGSLAPRRIAPNGSPHLPAEPSGAGESPLLRIQDYHTAKCSLGLTIKSITMSCSLLARVDTANTQPPN